MSVDYTAFIGIGWVISQEERERLIAANEKLIEEYPDEDIGYVEDEFSYINSYTCDTDIFLGKRLCSIDCGEWVNLTTLGTLVTPEVMERFSETYTAILSACGEKLGPGTKWDNPQIYLINQIW